MVMSNNSVIILSVLAIIISVLGTYLVIQEADNVDTSQNHISESGNTGQVGLYVNKQDMSGQIGMEVINNG